MAEKAGYPHFMLKEIYEQPWAVRETVLGRTSLESGRVFLEEMQIPTRPRSPGSSAWSSSRAARRGTRDSSASS